MLIIMITVSTVIIVIIIISLPLVFECIPLGCSGPGSVLQDNSDHAS